MLNRLEARDRARIDTGRWLLINYESIVRAARLMAEARLNGPVANLPADLIPNDEAEAYAIQDATVPARNIVGWKVAPAAPSGAFRCAPIRSAALIENGGVIAPDLAHPEIEAEVALVLSRDLNPDEGSVQRGEVLASIKGACLAIEVLGSCFIDRGKVSEFSTLADCQSNAGLVVGTVTAEWEAGDFRELRPRLVAEGGGEVSSIKPLPSTQAVLDAVCWLANHALARRRPLRSGQIIITGARVGPVPVSPGEGFTASAEGFGSVTVRRSG